MQRDPFTGHVLVSTPTRVLELDKAGVELGNFAALNRAGRTEISPDGRLFHLDHGYLGTAEVHAFDLPDTLP